MDEKAIEENYSIKKDIESFVGFKEKCLSNLETLINKSEVSSGHACDADQTSKLEKMGQRSHLDAYDKDHNVYERSDGLLKDDICLSLEYADHDQRPSRAEVEPSLLKQFIGKAQKLAHTLFS